MTPNWLNRYSIGTHLLLLFFIFFCLPFLVFGVIWYKLSSESIERNARSYNGQLVQQVSDRVDTYFEDLERLTLPVLTHSAIQDFLSINADEYYERIITTNRLERQVLSSMIFGREEISNASVYSAEGFAASSRTSFRYVYEDVFKQYMETALPQGNFQIRGVRADKDNPVIAITRNLSSTSSYQASGIFVLDIKLESISDIAGNSTHGDGGYIWLIDQHGTIVYHPDQERIGQPAEEKFNGEILSERKDPEIHHLKADNQLITYLHSAYSNFTVISQVSAHELNGELTSLRNITISSAAAMIAAALLAVGGYSVSITRALNRLKKLMKRVEGGDLDVQAPPVKLKEIGNLYSGFNHMVREIQRLIQVVHRSEMKEKQMQIKQRESALQSMQSQINPHFLYNTLEVINSYAIVEGVLPISRMSTALADIFRYSVENSGQIVTVKDELAHIRTYLMIQQQRYRDLRIEIEVQDLAVTGRVKSLKLILQPIVENAFKHGYERHRRKAEFIGIHDEIRDDMYVLSIKDHGGGMPAELVEQYNQLFLTMDETSQVDDDQLMSSSIGLTNVHYRIMLTFGKPYGLYICESTERGTTIEIRLPAVF